MSGKSKDTTLTDSIMAFFSPREFRKLKAEEAKPKQAVLLRQTDKDVFSITGTKNLPFIVIGTPASHRWVRAQIESGVDVYIVE